MSRRFLFRRLTSRPATRCAAALLLVAVFLPTLPASPALAMRIWVDPRAELIGSREIVEATVWTRVEAPRKDPPPGPWLQRLSLGCDPPWDASTYLVQVERRYKGGDAEWLWVTGRQLKTGRKYLLLASPYSRDPSLLAVKAVVPVADAGESVYGDGLRLIRSEGDPDSLLMAPLLRDLTAPDDSLRGAALRILRDAGLGHPRLVSALGRVLEHGTERDRLRVPDTVAGMLPTHTEMATPLLLRILADPNPEVRVEGLYPAARAGLWEEIMARLDDSAPEVRAWAALVIGVCGREHIDGLAARRPLMEDPDSEVRAAALDGMLRHDALASYPFWLESLEDEAGAVRIAALTGAAMVLSVIPRESLMTAFLDDPSPRVRHVVLKQLLGPNLDYDATLDLLADAVADPDAGVRRWGLRKLGDSTNWPEDAIPMAAPSLEDSDPTVRVAAARLWIKNEELPPGWTETRLRGELLNVFVTSTACEIRCQAQRDLVERIPPGKEQFRILEYGLADAEPGIRAATLCKLPAPRGCDDNEYPYAEARALILPLTKDEDTWVRARAWRRLEYLDRLTGD